MPKTIRRRATPRPPLALSWTLGQASDETLHLSVQFNPKELRKRWPEMRKNLVELLGELDKRATQRAFRRRAAL